MIIEEYDLSLFVSRFKDYGRDKSWSYSGLEALYDYIDETHDEESPYKMDVIELDGDWCEYQNFEDFQNNGGCEKDHFEDLEDLENETTVLKLDNGGLIVQTF